MSLPPPLTEEARGRLLQAYGRIAEFTARVVREQGHELSCGEGCDGCCRGVLSLRPVEAAYLLEGARALPPEAVSLVWQALSSGAPGCPVLQGGLCLAYEHRPALCRTHGLPMIRTEAGETLLHHCPRNFRETDVSELPPSLVLDEGRLSLLLDTVDALYRRGAGWDGERVAVDELLRAGLYT